MIRCSPKHFSAGKRKGNSCANASVLILAHTNTDIHARTHVRTHAHTHTHTHTHTHAHTRSERERGESKIYFRPRGSKKMFCKVQAPSGALAQITFWLVVLAIHLAISTFWCSDLPWTCTATDKQNTRLRGFQENRRKPDVLPNASLLYTIQACKMVVIIRKAKFSKIASKTVYETWLSQILQLAIGTRKVN